MGNYNVYKLKDINENVLYVGFTGKKSIERFNEHAQDKYWINEIAEIEECGCTSETQARINEMIWINTLKPIFNKKDKFAGAIDVKLDPKYKKFSHSSYVFNGTPTNCAPEIENFTLVDIIDAQGANNHIGVYFDEYLNLYFSATDILNASCMNRYSRNKAINENSEHMIKCKYTKKIKGIKREYVNYMCPAGIGVDILKDCKLDLLKKRIINAIVEIHGNASIPAKCFYNKVEIEILKYNFLDELENLCFEKSDSSIIKRRLAYRCVTENISMELAVDEYNMYIENYNQKFRSEVEAYEIFAMAENIINEFEITYRDVFLNFSTYTSNNFNINFWKEKKSISKAYGSDVQSHFVVAMSDKGLYNLFIDFYNKTIA